MKKSLAALLMAAALPAMGQQPLTLKQCIEHATANNVQVKLADNARKQQAVALNTAKNARLPQVSAYASQSFNFGRGLTAENTYVSRNTASTSWGASASLPLFTGGAIPEQRKQAQLDLAAATADWERLKEDLGIQVCQAYLQVLFQEDLKRQAEAQLQLARQQETRIQRMYQIEKASGVELAEARSRTAQDLLTLTDAESSLKMALLTLSQLIEWETLEGLAIVRPDTLPPLPPAETPQEIFNRTAATRPALTAANFRIESAEKAVKIARSAYLPTLSLSAGIGSSFYKTKGFESSPFGRQMRDNFATNVGLSLNIPIFNRFSTRNSVRRARLALQSQIWQMDDTRKTLYKEIQQAWYNATTSHQKLLSSKAAETAALEAFLLMEKKYENGKANATEYNEARTRHFTAATQRISTFYEYLFRMKILDFYKGEPLE